MYKSVETMLAEGELDAVIHSSLIKPILNGDPRVARLWPDYKAEEIAFYKKTQIFPIMHVMGIKQEIIERHPWVPINMFHAFQASKAMAMKRLNNPRIVPLAWYREAWEEQEKSSARPPGIWPDGAQSPPDRDHRGLLSRAGPDPTPVDTRRVVRQHIPGTQARRRIPHLTARSAATIERSWEGSTGPRTSPAFIDRKVMAELTAKMLLEVEAVRFMEDKPFIFTSGWASPVYIDCRRLIAFKCATPRWIGAATVFRDGFEQFDTVVGGETAGIPFAAWMADRLMLPMQYVRKKPKGFGRNAQIEGHLEPGQRVLLVEDLTTDGGSKVNFCNALRAAGATVEHIFVIFFYGIYPNSEKILGDLNIKLHHLSTWWDCSGACPRPAVRSTRSSSARSKNSCTTRPAGRRRTAASRRPLLSSVSEGAYGIR